MEEFFFECPWCFQNISMLIDTSIVHQEYIEDCEVCCNPIELEIDVSGGKVVNIEVSKPQ